MENKIKGKKILLGVTGSIAAYKSPLLVRELIKSEAEVRVIMTPASTHFVTKTVLANLSKNPVITDMFSKDLQNLPAWHINYAHWCDLMIIAPCSATTLSRIANGLCDSALATLTVALPKGTPLLISPAMDFTMWEHPATQKNINTLKKFGYSIIPPVEGELASGLSGPGRMPDIETIINKINEKLYHQHPENKQDIVLENTIIEDNKLNAEIDLESIKLEEEFINKIGDKLKNKKVLITAGPTFEKIDDVRFIGNFSSGKMGYAIAEQAALTGAEVTLISGPVSLKTPKGVRRIDIQSANEMYDSAIKEFESSDIAILAAAVSDYKPIKQNRGKLKKDKIGKELTIDLKATNDILHQLGLNKKPGQQLIGFALESSDAINNGWKKLQSKNCNMIVVNSVNKPDSGFGGDKNTISILHRDGSQFNYKAMNKTKCAQEILLKIDK